MTDPNFPDGSMDEISLGDAHYRDDEEIAPKVKNIEYHQDNSFKGIHRTFILYDNIYLFCTKKAFNIKKLRSTTSPEHRITLTYLDPKPVRHRQVAWRPLLWGLIFIAAAILSVFVGEFSGSSIAHPYMLPAGILFGAFGFVLLLLFYYKSFSLVIYRSYAGRLPLVTISHHPRQKEYKDFIALIEQNIKSAQLRNGITMRDRLVGEMKDLRRLKDAKVISDRYYNAAQAKILKHESYRS